MTQRGDRRLRSRLERRVEDLGLLALGRGAVGIDKEVLVAVVRRLERCARLDVDEAARGHVLALGRVAEVHRERPGEDDERLLLERMLMAPALGAGLVAPEVRASMGEAGQLAQLGDMTRRLVGLVGTGRP